ncbi:MAG: 3-deoxy-D-manno-octulosonic acid transferase [Rhodobacteraceae bacterium]|jgi:3-deoxy-D-manno-octulosonic-acid transferase|nr:3-deoxy-D-manno-octulosonic acid transferase [Paracoccaceae bacterium]
MKTAAQGPARPRPRAPLLAAYLGLARVAGPLWRLALARRTRAGKEDPARVGEKLGRPGRPRPDGTLLWFHAVSVGESLALLTLLQRLGEEMPEAHFLLTTITRTSAEALAKAGLPARVIHQFAPADAPGPVRAFLDHWHPDAAVVSERDLWPLTLTETHARGIPMMLINARVTNRGFKRRKRLPALYRGVYGLFDRILMQNEDSRTRFVALGAPAGRLEHMGVLKTASAPLPDRPEERARLEALLGDRPRWVAGSTHRLEEAQILDAHAAARAQAGDLLLILAPRQPDLADATEAEARARFASGTVARRSRGEALAAGTAVYIADTIGDMGLWFRLCPVAFMGHSLPVEGRVLTGKNPWEAIALGALVLHGPNLGNFAESYAVLRAAGASVEVADAAALAAAVAAAQDAAFRAPRVAAATAQAAAAQAALDHAAAAVRALLAGAAAHRL